jgi:type I restriction enzyme S subunit
VEAMKDLHLLKLVRVGDFVISLRSFQGGIEYAYYQGIISPAYTIMIPKDMIVPQYFKYLAKSRLFIELLQLCVTGIREGQNIDYSKLKNHQIPVPPRSEQDQIVRYLDWQVSKINKLIAAKKKKITLLNEQKQVIINNAVTKGLDPMAQMKDSGIEWIGTIPQEWSISRLKTQVSLATSKKVRNDELYIGMENIQSWTGMYVCATSVDSEGICNVFENNNILFGKLRPYLAKVYLTNSNGVCSSEFLVIRSFSGCMKYLFYVLLSYKFIDLVNSSTYGAKMPRANWSFIGNCSIPVPPLKEQIKIVLYLDERCNAIENIKSNIQNEVKLLYEYRTRLISDVVTGQIDVRDIEIPEYEYAEEESNEESDEMEGADEEAEEQEE